MMEVRKGAVRLTMEMKKKIKNNMIMKMENNKTQFSHFFSQ